MFNIELPMNTTAAHTAVYAGQPPMHTWVRTRAPLTPRTKYTAYGGSDEQVNAERCLHAHQQQRGTCVNDQYVIRDDLVYLNHLLLRVFKRTWNDCVIIDVCIRSKSVPPPPISYPIGGAPRACALVSGSRKPTTRMVLFVASVPTDEPAQCVQCVRVRTSCARNRVDKACVVQRIAVASIEVLWRKIAVVDKVCWELMQDGQLRSTVDDAAGRGRRLLFARV
jgi:hypothetical protein